MHNKYTFETAALFCGLMFVMSFANVLQAEMISTQKIGFVDIEKVYSQFKMKSEAEDRLNDSKAAYKQKIEDIDKQIRAIKAAEAAQETIPAPEATAVSSQTLTGTALSTSTAQEMSAESSTGTVHTPTPEEKIAELKKEKQALIDEAKKSVDEMKDEFTAQIMGRIYDVVKQIADERGFNVVINRSDCLYGIPGTDLTGEVLKKLK